MTTQPTRPALGAPAPELVGTMLTGERWDLSAQQGHQVVLIFHRHSL